MLTPCPYVNLLSKHFRCHSIDTAINAWYKNHFGVTLDVSSFLFFSVSPLCSAALVIITRMPSGFTAANQNDPPPPPIRDVNLKPGRPVSAALRIKNILHRLSLFVAAAG